MKLSLILLAIIGLIAVSATETKNYTKYADNEFLVKQKFLLEILYRVEDPLMFEEYIKLGKSFVYNEDDYLFPEQHSDFMKKFYEAYKYGVTLPKGEFFGSLAYSHFEQMYGLFEFFYYAKTWEIFQRNVCWARMHFNEGMFVQALTLAVIHRDDFEDFMLPHIYEIFPQHFFNRKFIYKAEKFDYNVWSKSIMYEKQYKDFLYKDQSKQLNPYNNKHYFYTKDWQFWKWWKLMGMSEDWYSTLYFMLRDNMSGFLENSKYMDVMNDVKMFFMPIGYTRDVHTFNEESALSYFTEDVEWNSYWYYFNMDYYPYLKAKDLGLKKERRGEYYFYVVRQMLARYYLERLSHRRGKIPEFNFFSDVKYGYDPQLVNYNGVGYSYRKNYYEYGTNGNADYMYGIIEFFKRMDKIITEGYFETYDGKVIDMRKPESIDYLGDMMQGNVDNYDKYFATLWYMYAHMYFAHIDDNDFHIHPNIFLNYETMMRDPMFYMIYKKFTDVIYKFYDHIEPYTYDDLYFPGIFIEDVNVSNLMTYFDLFDFDVTNLLNDKMTFVDGQFVWDKTLLARQMALNHRDFDFEYIIKSRNDEKVIVRAFLGPKYDEIGRVISLNTNRENFVEIDHFYYELKLGVNTIKRRSKDFMDTADNRIKYTELYKLIMMAYGDDNNNKLALDNFKSHCAFPNRLILPRGWEKGMPMQLLFYVYPVTDTQYETQSFGCGRRLNDDDKPFGFPLDRKINEFEFFEFFVPNMLLKDIKIYHEYVL
ncbi:arylphorin subunit C223-like [Musca vetustissima]|uniref:arylphorin subunit C223-like n=1 Tax=Musca vetustissima TaxID=27455 RepID=UPI002AB783E6|nr:arylphorin subunit C223-like [Musca vetustissima]